MVTHFAVSPNQIPGLCVFGRQSNIPKQFRAPRPTSHEVGRSERLLRAVPIESISVLFAIVLVALQPLGGVESALAAFVLHASRVEEAPKSAVLVRVSPTARGLAACQNGFAAYAQSAGATRVVWMPPADTLCASLSTAELAGTVWQDGFVRRDARRRVVGATTDRDAGRVLGLPSGGEGNFLLPFALSAVPSVGLHEVLGERLPKTVFRGRTVVVDLAEHARLEALEVTATIASAQEGGARAGIPGWLSALLGGALAFSVALVGRRRLELSVPLAVGLVGLLALVSAVSIRYFQVSLYPLLHLWLSIGAATVVIWVPRFVASRTALVHAGDLVERAALMRSEGIHLLEDEEFWPRLGDLASQAHPADSVLVAEVPPKQWHLRFWPYRGQGENVISERRRDMRRTPYSSEEGVPGICVTHRYLVMEGVPTVVVPLIALGEVEGYVFLLGDKAKQAHLDTPEIAERMSRDFGFLIRRRRVGEASQRGFRRTTQRGYWNASASAAKLVEGAEVAVGDLKMFGSLIRNAPIGLLYSDAFGHVRIVSRDVMQWLSEIGVSVPSHSADAPLSPGSLRIGTVLNALAKLGGREVSLVELAKEGASSSFVVPAAKGAAGHRFTLRALHEESDGVSWVAGYVGALVVESRGAESSEEGQVLAFRPQTETDSLRVRSLSDCAQAAARSAMAQVGKPVRFEPARYPGYAIAYHDELRDALTDLLCELAPRDPSGRGPVVAVAENDNQVELTILDLQFGLPISALMRVLLAPSDPPAGLEVFGRFVRAVVESHGSVKLSEDDWGLSVKAELLRARPLRRLPSMRPSAMAPPRKRRHPSG